MKKIILAVLVCSLFSCELSESKKSANEKVAIYDNNFERKLIELKYDDIIDGYVSKDGIKYCRELNLENLGLFDLKGIEAFDSLRQLNVSDNQLTIIDLSKNTELVKLDVYDNLLTSIDLSKNTKLVMFDANYQNDNLTKLNIDGCDSLEYFYLPKNLPESIEIDLKNKGFNRSKSWLKDWERTK